MQQNN